MKIQDIADCVAMQQDRINENIKNKKINQKLAAELLEVIHRIIDDQRQIGNIALGLRMFFDGDSYPNMIEAARDRETFFIYFHNMGDGKIKISYTDDDEAESSACLVCHL